MEFHILGEVRLHIDGVAADLGPHKNRALLGLFLYMGTRPVQPQTLVDALWDEDDLPIDPRGTVQANVAKLRAKLNDAGCGDLLPKDPRTRTYRVAVDFDLVDYYWFKNLAKRARIALAHHDYQSAISDLTEATRLWKGPLIAELDTEWADRHQETATRRTLLPAYYALCDAHLRIGTPEEALNLLDDELAEHHLDESLAQCRVRALAAAGRGGEIQAYYHEFRRHYLHEMDAEPAAELVALVDEHARTTAPASIPGAPRGSQDMLSFALPRDLPHFADRTDLMAELDRLLIAPTATGAARVVTLDGPPGVGKTSLAIHWAHNRSRHFSDGVVVINLGGHGQTPPPTTENLLAQLLTTFGATPTPPGAPVDLAAALYQTLSGKKLLVVLDDAHNPTDVSPILAAFTPCPVLITSRPRLTSLARHVGARHLEVHPLTAPDSVSLISGRNPTVEPATAQDIADLCEGLPMGMTIVADHLTAHPTMPADELVAQLRRDKRQLLDAGGYDDLTLTLRSTFAPSYEALLDEARQLFRLLGLHPTPRFSTAAAAAIAARDAEDTQRLLTTLCRANLLRQEHLDIYRLHDLLHVYAAECAVRDETPDARHQAIERQLDWYLLSADAAYRLIAPHKQAVPALPTPPTTTGQSFTDSSAATKWCVDERSTLIAAVRMAADHSLHHHCWRLVAEIRELFQRYGDQQENIEIHQIAVASAHAAKHGDGEVGTLSNLGTIHYHLRQFDQAHECYTKALEISQRLDRPAFHVELLHNLGSIEVEHGNFRKGLELYNESIVLNERLGGQLSLADTHKKIGEAYRRQERHREAREHYHLASNLSKEEGNSRLQGIILGLLAALHLETDEPQTAIHYAEQGLTFNRKTLDEIVSAETLATLAEAHHRLRHYQAARDAAAKAVQIHRAVGTLPAYTRTLDLLAELHSATGDYQAARHHWEEALPMLAEPRVSEVRAQLDVLHRFRTTSSITPMRQHRAGDQQPATDEAAGRDHD